MRKKLNKALTIEPVLNNEDLKEEFRQYLANNCELHTYLHQFVNIWDQANNANIDLNELITKIDDIPEFDAKALNHIPEDEAREIIKRKCISKLDPLLGEFRANFNRRRNFSLFSCMQSDR